MRKLRENELEFLKAFMFEAGNLTEGPAHLAAKALGVEYWEVTQMFGIALGAGEMKGEEKPAGQPGIPWNTAREFWTRLEELGGAERPE